MTQILEIDTGVPWWKWDLDKAINEFKRDYGVEPHLIIGKNVMDALTEGVVFINSDKEFKPEGVVAMYQSIPFEYDPDISCVILKA